MTRLNILFIIFPVLLFIPTLTGCVSVPKPPAQLTQFDGREVSLKKPCYLEERVLNKFNTEVKTLWENGQPTGLVVDEGYAGKPVKTLKDSAGYSYFFPATNYPHRRYTLTDDVKPIEWLKAGINFTGGPEGWRLGPHRVFFLPAGTKIFITKVYSVVPFMHEPSYYVSGKVTVAEVNEEFTFEMFLGIGGDIHEPPWE